MSGTMPEETLSDADVYLSLQIRFLKAIQTKDFAAAFDLSEAIEKRWPNHPNVAFFREVMEDKVKQLDVRRANRKDSGTAEEAEEDSDSDTASETSSEEDEETKNKNKQFEDMHARMKVWEEQLESGDVEGMKEELMRVGILRNERPVE